MLAPACSAADWVRRKAVLGAVGFGWCGTGEDGLVADDRYLVAVDARFYGDSGAGAGKTEAARFLQLIRRHGFEGAVQRLNGDFALACYERDADTLWLARDRLGVRPLYYVAQDGRMAFGSRPASLLALPGVAKDPRREFVALFAASHYRYFDNLPECSPYEQIAQLPAAHILKFKAGRVSTHAYWELRDEPDFDEPEEILAERYRQCLIDAVSTRFDSAASPAFTLSGGMDSSSVLASAVHVSGRPQMAYSTVYEDKTFDESADIQPMLAHHVDPWRTIAVNQPDVFSIVRRLIAAHDEPVATATWLSHYLLCERACRDGVGTLFGGLGGDEMNAGEYEHFLYFFADLRAAGDETRLRAEVEKWAQYHDHPIYRKSYAEMEKQLARMVDLSVPGKCLPDRSRMTRYAAALNPDYFDLNAFTPVMDRRFTSYLKNRTYQDLFRETIPCCLRAEDRDGMAFGISNRLPFLDYRLVEFMFRVPGTLKYRAGVTKNLLRAAMRGLLPEETRLRVKKTGWNAPAHRWFSESNLAPLMDLVRSRRFRERGVYQVEEVERIIREHMDIVSGGYPKENHMMFLWQLVNLELWFQTQLDA
jgi:asparagine synthase (glutamine-hydrolysing)